MWARLQDGKLAELVTLDPAGRYHPDLTWMQVPADLAPFVTAVSDFEVAGDEIAPAALPPFRAKLLAALADRRWRDETKGALVAGHRYHTDGDSQAKLSAAVQLGDKYEAINGAGSYGVTWKTMDGFVTLDLAALTNTALLAGAHVQAAYAREAAIAAAITSATDWREALTAYTTNINTGWPA